ncbi:MAG: hypothetical protein NZ839_01520 [Endomicrobia bacterium]|nr:hypothetical protein [Endomicrobiia bacterium]
MTIKQYINKFLVLRILYLLFRYIITSINIFIGGFLLSVLIDKCVPLPIVFFHIYWFFIIIILIIFFVNLVVRIVENIIQPWRYLQEELIKLSKLNLRDEVINAYLIEKQLNQQYKLNFSVELATKFVNNVKHLLAGTDLYKIAGFDKLFKVLPLNFVLLIITCILYFLPPYVIKTSIHKIIFTRKPEILGIFISPKNTKVPYRSVCEIKVSVEKSYEMYTPRLFLKTDASRNFYEVNFDTIENFINRKVYKYKINSVELPIFYRIKFRGVSSQTYVIEPILYPEISKLVVNVIPPQYTQMKPYTLQSFAETKYIIGSKVKFHAETNKNLQKVIMYINNKEVNLIIQPHQKSFIGDFVVVQDTELVFKLWDDEGLMSESIKYKINILEDKPPEVEIISPETDVIVMPNTLLPIVYSVKDDISVSKVEFSYKIKQKQKTITKIIKKYDVKTTESIEEYIFDLSKLKLNFGDIITYTIIAYDNDTVFGPKIATSKECNIEIFSYERQHQEIQKGLEQFVDKTLNILDKEIELYQYLTNLTTYQMQDIEKIISKHKQLNKQFEDINSLLKSMLDKMVVDPYTSIETYSEFKNLSTDVENIYNKLTPELIDNLVKHKINTAKKLQEEIIENLERTVALSKDILKRQNMENIAKSMNEVSSTAKHLMETLQLLSLSDKINDEELTKITNLLKEIEEKLKNINNLIKTMPEQLPMDFINRRDIQNVDLISPMNMLQNILQLVQQGNISSAIKQAEQLLKQLDLLAKTFLQASSEISGFSMSEIDTRLKNIIEEIDNLITAEQQIFQETKEIDKYRISEILKQQEKLIAFLREKIKNVVDKINNILKLSVLKNMQSREFFQINSLNVINNLQKILLEIESKKLIKTPEFIQNSVNIWQQNLHIVPKTQEYIELSTKTVEVYMLLQELDELVNKDPIISYPQKIRDKNVALYNEQNEVIRKTKEFLSNLRESGKKSFIISTDDIGIGIQAQNEMGHSANTLFSYNFPQALQHQNSAINLLMELKNNFLAKQNQLQKIKQQQGQSMGGLIQSKNLPGGKVGVLTGRVILPSLKDYIPPKELRKDIIQSLSEKYPAELQKVIENYYKELLK